MTSEEVKLWVRLRTWRSRGYHFRRQAPLDGYVVEKRDARFRSKGYRIARLWNADVNRESGRRGRYSLGVSAR
jgi:very-short-patch-repair endonuclease